MIAWGHATSSVGEYVETQKCHIFIHFILCYSLHFIVRELYSFHSFHHHHPFFISFTIHEHLFSDNSSIALCFIHIDIHIGMIHKDKEKDFLCTMILSMHINSLSFSVNVWLNYYAARKQMMKWMLLTQEPTFFTFMVVTQEPTIRKMSVVTHAFHIMKWMLLTQEPTFFIVMVVTQEPTIRKCQLWC